MLRINDIIDKVTQYNPDADTNILDRAYIYSARVHNGQNRLSGESYLAHYLEVAYILADMRLDISSIAAGLLHDIIEQAQASPEDIRAVFGDEILHIVSGVTQLNSISAYESQDHHAESIRKMILAMADDLRVIFIKLADRLNDMQSLHFYDKDQQTIIAQETLDIYAPIASRLGIYSVKKELEDLSFKYIFSDEYATIKKLIKKGSRERDKYLKKVKNLIKAKMDQANLKCKVTGRHKHFFSIYQKMFKQHLAFEEIYDIIAFRIIFSTIPECYEALGIIHSMWKPIPKKIKDYIAVPKPNMYQSLHTTVIGPYGERIEIQIRTWKMDKIAKSGIAAHWGYKEGKSIDKKTSQTFAWIHKMVENHKICQNSNEFLENVKIDLFPDEVYVFTPEGEVKSLPMGATPVDFAYAIHSDVGHQCVGAKINGRMRPLKIQIKTGDRLEIITAKNHHPSKDWLNFVKTAKARSKIRQWIKSEEKDRSLALGREICEKTFRKHKLNFNKMIKAEKADKALKEFKYKTIDDLVAAVGYGKITPIQLMRCIGPSPDKESTAKKEIHCIPFKKKLRSGIRVKGLDDILIRFGNCCNPLPGDNIVGYITRGYGVTVHRANCVNALKISPERQIEVTWNINDKETYPVKIRVYSSDRIGLLADISTAISKKKANIINANTKTGEDAVVETVFIISVRDIKQLTKVISAIKRVKNVNRVKRIHD
ncbi:GTP pyrophosphokinase [Candidatus Magnetomoraceae bacterium gMMP-15]